MASFVCFRSANQVASLEQMFRRDGVMSHYKAMSLNCILVDSCVNWLQRLKESSCGDDGKWLLGKCLLWTRSFLATEVSSRCIYVLSAVLLFVFVFLQTHVCCSFFMQIKTGTDLNQRTICTSSVPIRSESYGLHSKDSTLNNVEQCQTVDYICVNEPCRHEFHILQRYLYGRPRSGPPESCIFFLSNNQVILTTFVIPTEATFSICSSQVCMLCNFFFANLLVLCQCWNKEN